MKTIALRAIPVFGWLYLLAGLIAALLNRAPASRTLRALWWADAVLSTVGHAAQIPIALAADELASRPRIETAVMTQIFGLTWWRTRAPAPVVDNLVPMPLDPGRHRDGAAATPAGLPDSEPREA
jgi:hypothetical protein